MLRSYITMILLLLPANQFNGQGTKNACNNLLCNNEAFCEIRSGNPICQCIGSTYFKGQYCKVQIDNCATNPCQNGAKCTNALGQPICGPCPPTFGGHLCDITITNDLMTKIYFHHNRYAYVASDQNFIFMVESLGKVHFQLELYADNYVIEAFSTNPAVTQNRWRKSNDLRAIVRHLGLYHSDKLPYPSGYYYVTHARFWEHGIQTLRLKVSDVTSQKSYMDQAYAMEIRLQPNRCRPQVDLIHCSDPFQPQMLDVTQFNKLYVIVRKHCWSNSQIRFDWKVYNNIETVLLHSYGETTTPRIKINPYPFWASRSTDVIQSYLISIGITEADMQKTTYIVKRCYVFVISKPVIAQIVGGLEREVGTQKTVYLDGSRSRDLAIERNAEQHLIYKWSCVSGNDPGNQYCNNFKSTEVAPFIRTGKLKIENTYDFVLNVKSEINSFSRDQTIQSIKPVQSEPLYVDIECVRNCEQKKFVPLKLLHLKAICRDCASVTQYIWTINDKKMTNSGNRLIIEKPTNDATLTAQVQIVSFDRKGNAKIKLSMNNAPSGGECKITPSSGIEYETEFKITCINFDDPDLPLSYEFAMESAKLDRTSESSTKVRLPKGNTLNIQICDSLHACTIQTISVVVSEDSNKLTDIETFLQKKDGKTLKQLITNGAIQQAMILAATAARLISSNDNAKYLGKYLNQFDLLDVLDIEQYFYTICEMLKKMKQFESEGAMAMFIVIQNLNTGLRTILSDGDGKLLSLQIYDELQKDIATIHDALENQKENFIPVQDIELLRVHTYDRIAEPFVEIDINDPIILQRLFAWLQFSTMLDEAIGLLGQIATYTHEPEEPMILTEQSELHFKTFSIEDKSTLIIEIPGEIAKITMGTKVIEEIKMLLSSSSVLLQMIGTRNNPYWWYPDRQNIVTGILHLSAFSRKMTTGILLTKTFNITFQLKNPKAIITPDSSTYMHGRLIDHNDMNIFEMLIPSNALLLITFVSTTIDLRVALQLQNKPTGYLTHKSKTIIRKGGSIRPLMLMNERGIALKAYLGIVPLNKRRTIEMPGFFNFIPILRQCLSWDFDLDDPQWTGDNCQPIETESIENGLECECKHLSTYAGQIYPTDGFSLYGVGGLLNELPINWLMLCSQLALGLMFMSWFFLTYLHFDSNREYLILMPKISPNIDKDAIQGEIFVRFRTGGDLFATTTAGVFIIIYTLRGPLQYKIYQNPLRPQLTQHSTCVARIPCNPALLIRPLSLHIKHDGGGRYPSWFLHSVEIIYEGLQKPIKFKIDTWLTETGIDVNEIMAETARRRHGKFHQFMENFEMNFANWFFFNPLFGPWKCGNQTCNRFERTIIWIIKLALTILIISIYFGWTSIHNYEEERDDYRYLNVGALLIFILSLISFVVGCTIQLVIKFLLLKCNYEVRRNTTV